ncbi:MAG: DUF87 domain-containing protein [Gammaproteobacteria bacterium]|nr:DUF87 domain-containing protein [Gammaproteobacteria bacterium]
MNHPRLIGHVVSVQGFWVQVELSHETKSPSRATPDGVQIAVAINSYLTFDIGAGVHAIGVLTELETRVVTDSAHVDELTLEPVKTRRIASIQLLGTVRMVSVNFWQFDAGITIMPTLDTLAEIAGPDILSCIFESPPVKNQPQKRKGIENEAGSGGSEMNENYDYALEIGHLSSDENINIKISFNDIFTRPLAVIGNTGAGKSCTVASLLQRVVEKIHDCPGNTDSHIFILDTNGEYASAFLDVDKCDDREPSQIYLNGKPFCLPAWLMNGEEVCAWLLASDATQEPVLKDWWALAKAKSNDEIKYDPLDVASCNLDTAIEWLTKPKGSRDDFYYGLENIEQYVPNIGAKEILAEINWSENKDASWSRVLNHKVIMDKLFDLKKALLVKILKNHNSKTNIIQSADTPRYIPCDDFYNPKLINRSRDIEGTYRIDQYLTTLKLRLRARLDDTRWKSFFSYEEQEICSYEKWIRRLGVGRGGDENLGKRISILDLSMLSSDVLPFVCAILGRLLLETREMVRPDMRNKHPWVLVLEEAHNYIRQSHSQEDRTQRLSRKAFERIAREGRKFGLSLVVASQRPSEISPTIISQCANFFTHRLQNPDDIEHIRKIVPKQAQRLLDQVTVLAAGEAIVFGSALHTPLRVQINRPAKEPSSSTAAPYRDWRRDGCFPIDDVLKNWGLDTEL